MGRVCAVPKCPVLAVDDTHCETHRRERQQLKRTQRSEAGLIAQSWYHTKRWADRRKAHLARHPFCQCPEHDGKRVRGYIVDHVEPHRGNAQAFWFGRLQTLTKPCHDSWKQRQERGHPPLQPNEKTFGERRGRVISVRTGSGSVEKAPDPSGSVAP